MFICLCLLCSFLHIIMLPFWNMFSISYFTMLFFYLFFIMYDSDYFTWNFNITVNKRSRFLFSLRHASVNWNSIISRAFHHNESHCSFMKSKIYIFQRQEVHQIITSKLAHSLNCFQIFFFLFSECVPFCISSIITRAVEDIQLMWMRIYFSQTDKMYLFMKAKGKRII